MKNWRTKEGKLVNVSDLSDEHVGNIVKMLQKNYKSKCIANWSIEAMSLGMENIEERLSVEAGNIIDEAIKRGLKDFNIDDLKRLRSVCMELPETYKNE